MAEIKRRAYKGYTHEPFQCCGKPAEEYGGRPKDAICAECSELIKEGKAFRAAKAKVGGEVYQWPELDYGWPGFFGTNISWPRGDVSRELQHAFWRLVNAVSVDAPGDTPHLSPNFEWHKKWDGRKEKYQLPWPMLLPLYLSGNGDWSFLKRILIDKETQAALAELHTVIKKALEQVYQHGKEKGSNVLLGLATGEVSMSAFDEALLPEEERRKRRR